MMNKLITALDEAISTLKKLTSSTLTADQLELTKKVLAELNSSFLIEDYLTTRNGNINADAQNAANLINKKADAFNDELQRIKKIKNTLNLEALEPVISAAGQFIRPVYQLTASLQEENDADDE